MNIQEKNLKPDILFVVNDFRFLESHRLNLIKHLSENGLKISVATNLVDCSLEEIKKIESSSINLVDFRDKRSSINIFSNILSLFKLFYIIKNLKPRKLSLISPKPIIFGGIVSFFLKIEKVYCTISGMGYVFIDKSLKAYILQKIIIYLYKIIFYKKNVRIIFQNLDDKDLFINESIVKKNKIKVIQGNGINTSKFLRKDEYPKKITFLFSSRLLIDKGINEYVTAAEKIGPERANFLVVGGIDPSNPKSLSSKDLEHLKSNNALTCLGKVNHKLMSDVFQKASVFVLPSYREGLPQVALEAAACSLPLILTDVNGCRDCVIEGENGFLVESHNHQGLVEKMNFFINNQDQVNLMGKKSRQYVLNNFSEDIIHNKFLNLYKD